MPWAVACGTRSDVCRRYLRTRRTRRTACARVAEELCAFEEADGVTVTRALRGDALDAESPFAVHVSPLVLGIRARTEPPPVDPERTRMGSRRGGRSAAREAVREWRGRARADA
jgi:hypothetical protein